MSFQAKLATKLEEFSVDDAIIELKNDIDRLQLNEIVKNLLKQLNRYDEDKLMKKHFDFLVGGRLLRLTVEEHLKLYSDEIEVNEILSEKLVEIEYILELEPPKPLEAIPHDDWVSSVDANNSYIISGSYDNSIRIFSIKDRKNILTISNAHEKPVSRVKFMNNFNQAKKNELYFVSGGHDEISLLHRFNTKTSKTEIVYAYRGHNRSVNCLDIQDDLIATGSFDKTLRLWSAGPVEKDDEQEDENNPGAGDVKNSKKQKVRHSDKSASRSTRSAIMTLTGHQESVTGVKWLGGSNEYNSLATSSMDRSICIWDVEVGECKRRVLSAKPLLGIDFCSERNLILSASCDRHIRIWDSRAPDNATAKAAYTSHNAWVSSVAFGMSSTDYFISGGYDNLVKLWDLRSTKACLYDLIGHHDKVLDVNWANRTNILSGSADATLKIYASLLGT